MIARLNQLVQTRFLQAQILQEHLLFVILQFGDLLFYLCADNENLASAFRRIFSHLSHAGILCAVICQVLLGNIGRINNRFGSKQIQGGKNHLFVLILRLEGHRQLSILQQSLHPFQKRRFLGSRFIHSGLLAYFGNSSFQNFNIRKNQFQINRLNIAQRIDGPIYMDYVGILKAAHHMNNSVHFPDVTEELISQSLPFGGTLYQTGDVHEFNHCRSHFFGMIHISQQLQPLIRHRYDSYIGINGTEGIIGRFRTSLGQGIEQRTFSYIGKSYNT